MRRFPVVLIAALATGCTAGRNYERPPVDLPDGFRAPMTAGPPSTASIADAPWWNLFQDEQLQALIRTALEQNYDLRIAAARILEAQAQLGITRADQYPSAAVGTSIVDQKTPAAAVGFPTRAVEAFVVQGSAAWQLDFWGRYRRATESARAQLLATEWGRKAVGTTLVTDEGGRSFGRRA